MSKDKAKAKKNEAQEVQVENESCAEQVMEEKNEQGDALQEKTKQYDDLLDKYQRMAAEYDNYRKRSQKEKEQVYNDSVADTVALFIPVLDNLERAAKADEIDGAAYKKGVEMVLRQLLEVLTKCGVAEIEAKGCEFDPQLHNAVMHIEDECIDTNTVVEEFAKGYTLRGRVIRHSMVKVAN